MQEITVIGGGMAGLIAASEVGEAGARVRLFEARSRLGGRAVSTKQPYVANLGPHAPTTWRDRAPIAYRDCVWLAGDWVAAPGHLSEVACNSAITAARSALGEATRRGFSPVGVRAE